MDIEAIRKRAETDEGAAGERGTILALVAEVERLRTALAASCEENRSVALAEPGRTATCPLVDR